MSTNFENPNFDQGGSNRTSSLLPGFFAVLGVLTIGFLAISMFLPVTRAREASRRTQCKNNLRQIALALHNYVDKFGAFPPAYTVDTGGRPLHSWRTLILPFMDQQPLYDSIDLTKPWDDPVNAEAFKTRLACYQCPASSLSGNLTAYLGCVGPDAFFHPTESRRFADIRDGTSNTLTVIEVDVAHAVPWMSPRDADLELVLNCGQEPKPNHLGGMHVALADGSVRFVSGSLPAETRRALLTIDGGEELGEF